MTLHVTLDASNRHTAAINAELMSKQVHLKLDLGTDLLCLFFTYYAMLHNIYLL